MPWRMQRFPNTSVYPLQFTKPDRVRVTHAGGMERPVRLTIQETLCLVLGLRGTAASSRVADPERRAALLARAEAHLGPPSSFQGDGAPAAPDVAAPERGPDPSGIRETLLAAARHRRRCAVVYAKPDEDDLTPRVIHPYVIAYASGAWYVVGHCRTADGVRNFRLDRIVAADPEPDTFDVPDDFRVEDWVGPGRVYRADHDTRVRVRYAPRVARWVRERAELPTAGWTEERDGSVVVDHRVADPHWVVRHTLQYGGAAEILEPEELRALVLEVVEGMEEE